MMAPDLQSINSGKFNWGVAATDIEWGYDGKLYVSDFVSGWAIAHCRTCLHS
jgi:hypothetical protein